jgi:carbonic anhydrase
MAFCLRCINRFPAATSLVCLLFLFFFVAVPGVGAAGGPEWSYDAESESGPEYWGDISEKYKACKEGLSQSPVDIAGALDVALPRIEFNYAPTKLNIINNGHTIVVKYDKGSSITIAKEKYKLMQFHFHTPSEHLIDGLPAVMEMHLVHKSNRGKLAVVGVLFHVGAENINFESIWANLPEKPRQKRSVGVKINAINLLPGSKSYYAYSGSLTTPPCTEGVKWHVLRAPLEVSEEQLMKIESILGANSRLVQPLNERELKK